MIALVFQRLRQGEAEQLAVAVRQAFARQGALQGCDVRGIEADGVEIRQPEPAFGVAGVEAQHMTKPGHRRVDPAQARLCPRQ